jgi:hypothetical protein
MVSAVCVLKGETVFGTVKFVQNSENAPTMAEIKLEGLTPGLM